MSVYLIMDNVLKTVTIMLEAITVVVEMDMY